MRYIAVVLLLLCSFSISHGYDLEKISKADLSGIWATKKSFVWLYKDRSMKLYDQVTCGLKATGKWKFEMGKLHMYIGGKEVFWRYVLELPKKWYGGQEMRLADNSRWMFHGRDTSRKCD